MMEAVLLGPLPALLDTLPALLLLPPPLLLPTPLPLLLLLGVREPVTVLL